MQHELCVSLGAPNLESVMSDQVLRAGLSERIVRRASELGLSQMDIVRGTGAAKATVNRWFSSGAIPRGEHAVKLRNILKVSQEWLDGVSSAPVVKDEAHLYAVLDKTSKAATMEDLNTTYVGVPLWSAVNNTDEQLHYVHRNLLPDDCVPSSLVWFEVKHTQPDSRFSRGDKLIIDTDESKDFVTDGYYAFKSGGSVSIFRIEFAPLADEYTIKDGTNNGAGTSVAVGDRSLRDLFPAFMGRIVTAIISL